MAEHYKKNIIVRLNRIEGQIRGIKGMIEEDAECQEILNQVAAVKAAMGNVGLLIFEKHAHSCIRQALEDGEDEKRFAEIVAMMNRLMK